MSTSRCCWPGATWLEAKNISHSEDRFGDIEAAAKVYDPPSPHAKVADLFFEGIGRELQYSDARIAGAVYEAFTARGKLGINDSFLTKDPRSNKLAFLLAAVGAPRRPPGIASLYDR